MILTGGDKFEFHSSQYLDTQTESGLEKIGRALIKEWAQQSGQRYRYEHIVLGITNKSDPNYYDEEVQLCTRISYSGEYLHSAPWNMADHGKRNSSHGCINLSPEDAQWVFDNFILGDVVEVKNSPKPLPVWDGLGDWQLSYDQY